MTTRGRYSLLEAAPPGFRYVPQLTTADVRREAFALFAGTLDEALTALKPFPRLAAALVVTKGPAVFWTEIAASIFHLEMPGATLEANSGIIDGYLGLMRKLECTADLAAGQNVELRRAMDDRRRAREEFEGFRRSLVEEMTERRAVAEQLEESKKNLSIILDSIADAVVATDRHGLIVSINPVGERLTNCKASEVNGMPLWRVLALSSPSPGSHYDEFLKEALSAGSPVEFPSDAVLLAKDGGRRRVAGTAAPMRDESGGFAGMVVAFRDITERELLEEQYRHSQKMESIGRLAGGVAHDFNNLLGGIMGYSDLLLFALKHGTPEYEYAHGILEASQHAAHLTRQLLSFSRRGRLTTVEVNLHAVIRETVDLLSRAIDPAIEIETKLYREPMFVLGDLSELQSMLINLGINARDSMENGGILTFETRPVTISDEGASFSSGVLPKGEYVQISVSDTGGGIDPKVLPRIFEPFFTTKPLGKGTGLGLAAVYGAIANHHGAINVSSVVGGGSTFTMYLPRLLEATESRIIPAEQSLPRGSECILLVDDEPALRTLGKELLSGLGHEVLLAESGIEALEIFRKNHEKISCVLLDLAMPKLSGKDTFRELKKIDPDVRVIICSGYSFDNSVRTLLEEGALCFLQKPYRLAELARVITDPSLRRDRSAPN